MSKKRKTTIKGKKLNPRALKTAVYKLLKRSQRKMLNPKQIIGKLKINNTQPEVIKALEGLVKEGKARPFPNFKYQYKRSFVDRKVGRDSKVIRGIVDMTRTGSAYIISDDIEEDVHVSAKYLKTAMNGDLVEITTWRPRGRRKLEGEVRKIIERATTHLIGRLYMRPKYGVVLIEGYQPMEITVEKEDLKEAQHGDQVVVKITDWSHGQLKGKVTTVMSGKNQSDLDMKTILVNNGFNLEFPEEVIAESEALSTEITKQEIAKRRDMRKVTTFTIDPETAKDFDDAISIEYLDDGNYEIGVHIADVGHYVGENTALDKEARLRSTSVYLVDRVLPMLPEMLSNELCSLRPHEEKLTFSAIFTFNKSDKLIDRWFGKTVIYSDRRFTYEEAQEIIEKGEGDFAAELRVMNRLAHKLRKKRFKYGAINFESDEVKFKLDENGVPIGVFVKDRKDAHLLVEDFMLLANREVATYIYNKGKQLQNEVPFVYRIHDEPDPDRVAELALYAKELGFEMDISTPFKIAKSYNRLVDASQKDPHLKILQPLAIRTMAKAVYSTKNIGHYGLGFDNYTHFTSPIRRYADVLVHRILFKNLDNHVYRADHVALEETCKHISKMERRAMDAERESVKYKQVEYLENHIGEVFDGVVSGFNERGFFVQLVDNFCEGRVSFRNMSESFDTSSRFYITGMRSGRQLRMGDDVRVKIVDTNLAKRQIEMALVDD